MSIWPKNPRQPNVLSKKLQFLKIVSTKQIFFGNSNLLSVTAYGKTTHVKSMLLNRTFSQLILLQTRECEEFFFWNPSIGRKMRLVEGVRKKLTKPILTG